MTSGRLPSITEDPDFFALSWAFQHDGELPEWLSEYTRDALVVARWVTPNGHLNEEGMDAAARWAAVKDQVARGWRDGGLAPVHPQDEADGRKAAIANGTYDPQAGEERSYR